MSLLVRAILKANVCLRRHQVLSGVFPAAYGPSPAHLEVIHTNRSPLNACSRLHYSARVQACVGHVPVRVSTMYVELLCFRLRLAVLVIPFVEYSSGCCLRGIFGTFLSVLRLVSQMIFICYDCPLLNMKLT